MAVEAKAEENPIASAVGASVYDPEFGTYWVVQLTGKTSDLMTCSGSFLNSLGHAATFVAYVVVRYK